MISLAQTRTTRIITRIYVWMTPEARNVGLVFQDHGLFPHLSVLGNVAFGLRARGVDRRTANAKAGEWLERMELAGYASNRTSAVGAPTSNAACSRSANAAAEPSNDGIGLTG